MSYTTGDTCGAFRVSQVADIVKGTFKGFALLRQLVGNPRPPPTYQMPPINPTSRPVYAPGYGLIPTSQVTEHTLRLYV